LAITLEVGTGVRDPEQHDPLHPSGPRATSTQTIADRRRAVAVVAGPADDQAAHAVAEQRDLAHAHGPDAHELLQQAGQLTTVARDVAAGVVPHVHRGDAPVSRQQVAVGHGVAAAEAPHGFVRHEAVDEDAQPGRGTGNGLRHRVALEDELRPGRGAQGHGHRQRRALRGQRVAEQPVEHRPGILGAPRQRRQQLDHAFEGRR
jgi:hypothetical protein